MFIFVLHLAADLQEFSFSSFKRTHNDCCNDSSTIYISNQFFFPRTYLYRRSTFFIEKLPFLEKIKLPDYSSVQTGRKFQNILVIAQKRPWKKKNTKFEDEFGRNRENQFLGRLSSRTNRGKSLYLLRYYFNHRFPHIH